MPTSPLPPLYELYLLMSRQIFTSAGPPKMGNSYNAAYAIPDAWLKGPIDHGDCPSNVHKAQLGLYYSIISRHPHLDLKLLSASSYIISWSFMACTDNERLRLWPVIRHYEGSVVNLFESADMEYLRGVCPKAEEKLLEKLCLHLHIVSEVSMYRDWIQIVRTEVNEKDAEAWLGERFVDANGSPCIKPRFPSGFFVVDPRILSWYIPSPSKIATKYEPSGPMLDDDIKDNNNSNNEPKQRLTIKLDSSGPMLDNDIEDNNNSKPEQRLTIKLDSTKNSLKAFIKFCTSLQKLEHPTFTPFNHSKEENAPKIDDFGSCSIDLRDEDLFRAAPATEGLQGWEDLGVAPLQVKEDGWELV